MRETKMKGPRRASHSREDPKEGVGVEIVSDSFGSTRAAIERGTGEGMR